MIVWWHVIICHFGMPSDFLIHILIHTPEEYNLMGGGAMFFNELHG